MKVLNLKDATKSTFGDKYFSEINNLTFAKLPAETLYARDYAKLFEQKSYLYIVVGTDSGLFYDYVKHANKNDDIEFLFIDYREVLEASDYLKDAGWDSTPSLVDERFEFTSLLLKFKHFILSRRIMLIKSFAVLDAAKVSPYEQLWQDVELRYNQFIASQFNAQNTKIFEIERIYNAPDNMIPVKTLEKSIEGCDAVVLGGGPTLDESINWIKHNQSKLIIFAAARIANRMAYEGIIPDFFVSVDPYPWSFDNAKGILAFHDRSVFITSFHAQHRLVSQWRGAHFFAGERYAWQHAAFINNIDAPGPTVTNSALHMAVSLGAQRVFLAGVDFCFAGGKTHESLSEEAKANDLFAYQNKMTLEDNLGNHVETEPAFYWAKHAMEDAIHIYKSAKNVEFFSLGSLSSKMKGVTYIATSDINLVLEDKAAIMLPIFEKGSVDQEQTINYLEEVEAEFRAQLNRFNKLKKYANEALGYIPKIYDKKTGQLKAKPASRVTKIKNKVTQLIGADGDMLVNYQAAFFADSFKNVVDEKNMTSEEVLEQLTAFFTGLDLSSKHFLESIDKGLTRVNNRIFEFESEKTCELLEIWRESSETGRAYIWQANCINKKLDDEQQVCLQAAIEEYEGEFLNVEHQYSKMLAGGVSNVSTLYQRAEKAYRVGNITELLSLYDHVSSMEAKDHVQKESFISFIKGTVEELNGDIEEAVDLYRQVEMPFFRRIALKRVFNIKVNQENYAEALHVLESLCQYSLDYMIPYADMLVILGSRLLAIEVLEMFIRQKPDAIDARIKLAQWQIEEGLNDSAEKTLNQVLELIPDNKVALHLLSVLAS